MNLIKEYQNDITSEIAVDNINNLIRAFSQCENIDQVGNALNCLPHQCLQQIQFCINQILETK